MAVPAGLSQLASASLRTVPAVPAPGPASCAGRRQPPGCRAPRRLRPAATCRLVQPASRWAGLHRAGTACCARGTEAGGLARAGPATAGRRGQAAAWPRAAQACRLGGQGRRPRQPAGSAWLAWPSRYGRPRPYQLASASCSPRREYGSASRPAARPAPALPPPTHGRAHGWAGPWPRCRDRRGDCSAATSTRGAAGTAASPTLAWLPAAG